MTYNTSRCQEFFRNKFTGVSGEPFIDFKNGRDIKNYAPDSSDINTYNSLINDDVKDYYYKAVLSFVEGIAAIRRNNLTWATVQLYYSIFYGIRCSLLIRKVLLLKARGNLYSLQLQSGKNYENVSPANDHAGSIKVYTSLFGIADFLCGNTIDDKNAYNWYENCRNIVNYRDGVFHDPESSLFWSEVILAIKNKGIINFIDEICREKNIFCFSEDYAVFSIPVVRIFDVAQELRNEGINALSEEQKSWVISILGEELRTTFNKILI